jgi:predicted tellurium resistance membrane protein TerC
MSTKTIIILVATTFIFFVVFGATLLIRDMIHAQERLKMAEINSKSSHQEEITKDAQFIIDEIQHHQFIPEGSHK